MALLPDMRHFMREGGEDGFIGAAGEAVRVHRQFVHSRFLDAAGKALRGEIASGLRVALQRHQHMGRDPANRSLNCVAGINRYTVPIGVLYAKKMMSKKRFIRDLSCCDSPTD